MLTLPRTDGMIRLVSMAAALLILAVPLSMRRIYRPLPEKNSQGLNLELICCRRRDSAMLKRWTKIHNPEELFAFSRSPEEKYLPNDEKRLTGKTLRTRFAPESPKPQKLAAAGLPELSVKRTAGINVIPPSSLRDEYEIPVLRALEVLDGTGKITGLTIAPVPFRGTLSRPVLFKLRSGRYGYDLQLLHSSGDRSFDAGVRRKLLQSAISGENGKLFCVWPQNAAKENVL